MIDCANTPPIALGQLACNRRWHGPIHPGVSIGIAKPTCGACARARNNRVWRAACFLLSRFPVQQHSADCDFAGPKQSMTSHSSGKQYYDLHITGHGYLNRIRELKSKDGNPFLACDVIALAGFMGSPKQRRFDVTVSGKPTQKLIRQYSEDVKAGRKVMIGFCLSDVWANAFTYTKGKNAGQTGVALKSRLFLVNWIKIDGEYTYRAEWNHIDASDDEDDAQP